MIAMDLLAGGARFVLLPLVQAVGGAWAALSQLLLPVWQVTCKLPGSCIRKYV